MNAARSESESHRLTLAYGIMTIDAPPPFFNELLKANPDIVITPEIFDGLAQIAAKYQPQLFMDAMNRQYDRTGFVSELLGRCHNAAEVRSLLLSIGIQELKYLEANQETREQVLSALSGGPCTIDALIYLNERHGTVTAELKSKRHPKAQEYRTRNLAALMHPFPDEMSLKAFFNRFTYPHHDEHVPSVHYDLWYRDLAKTRIAGINRRILVPYLPDENAHVLEHLTPHEFQRRNGQPDPSPDTPIGFMWQFRKAGDQLARVLAEIMKAIWDRHPSISSLDLQQALLTYITSRP